MNNEPKKTSLSENDIFDQCLLYLKCQMLEAEAYDDIQFEKFLPRLKQWLSEAQNDYQKAKIQAEIDAYSDSSKLNFND